jgi:ribosomal protein L37AE/L43A
MGTCPKCEEELTESIRGAFLTLVCPKCGWRVARSWTEPINEDETVYSLMLTPQSEVTKEALSAVSKIAGCNFLTTKELIENPQKFLVECRTPEMKDYIKRLVDVNVEFIVMPEFPY